MDPEEYFETLSQEKVEWNDTQRAMRYRDPKMPRFSVVVTQTPHFQVWYDAYEGDEKVRGCYDDQTPIEVRLFKLFSSLRFRKRPFSRADIHTAADYDS
jgi:hypothetical protein